MLATVHFEQIEHASMELMNTAMHALMGYKNEAMEIEKTAEMRIDRDEFIASHKEAARIKAETNIKEAQDGFSSTVLKEIGNLRNELRTAVFNPPKAVFKELVELYAAYGIQPTKTETQFLLDYNDGAYLGFQILDSVLERTGAPYRIRYTPISAFDADLQSLAYLADHPTGCTSELSHEFFEVMNPDATKNELVSSLVAIGQFQRTIEQIPEMTERWRSTTVPTIQDYKPYKNENGETITAAQQLEEAQKARDNGTVESHHSSIGKDLGVKKAAELRQAKETLESFRG